MELLSTLMVSCTRTNYSYILIVLLRGPFNTRTNSGVHIPYTQVNKRMRLFSKLQGNMRLIPNMHLIAKGKIDHTFKTAMPLLVARALYSK